MTRAKFKPCLTSQDVQGLCNISHG